MTLSIASQWIWNSKFLGGLVVCYYLIVVAADSDKLPTARNLQDNQVQHAHITPVPSEVEVCEGENVAFTFNVTIPANLALDRLYERTVWSPDRENHCVILRNNSKCYGALDFILRAEITESWSPAGEHTRLGKLTLQLNNVSMGDAGYYEGELKAGYIVTNAKTMLIVKETSACQTDPEEGDTATIQTKTGLGFGPGFGVGFVVCLVLVIIGGIIAKFFILKFRKKDEKSPDVPV